MSARMALIAVTALTVAGCETAETTNQRAGAGALIGAGLGAVTGAIIGDGKGAAIGAGVGALAGAGIGAYLDAQQRDLEANLAGTGATVTNTGEGLLVNLPAGVTFAFDSADIQPQFVGPLTDAARTLARYDASLIDVVGHTDSVGSESYNQSLSQRRADSVADFLVRRGVAPTRVAAYGRGETQPVASNESDAGRARNRRVELVITPQQGG